MLDDSAKSWIMSKKFLIPIYADDQSYDVVTEAKKKVKGLVKVINIFMESECLIVVIYGQQCLNSVILPNSMKRFLIFIGGVRHICS